MAAALKLKIIDINVVYPDAFDKGYINQITI